jgi:hypothetical protein
MAETDSSNTDELIADTILLGERAFEAATLLMIAACQRELLIFDPDLSRGGYQSLHCHETLQDFLSKGHQNRLTIVLHDATFFLGNCPRLQKLLQTYSHSISVYLTDESAHVAQDAFVLADGKHFLHRFHIDQARFRYVMDDEVAVRPLKERFEQLLDSTSSKISPTAIGL